MARPRPRPEELILRYLRPNGPATLVEITLATGLRVRTVAKALSGMYRDNLVARIPFQDAAGVQRALWDSLDDATPVVGVNQARRAAGTWRREGPLARTSVFDVRAFLKEVEDDGEQREQEAQPDDEAPGKQTLRE